jgi:hypothetical protein
MDDLPGQPAESARPVSGLREILSPDSQWNVNES